MGYMLCWGSFVWLPFMYTLQGKYLVQYPVQLTPTEFMAILGLGLCGYLIFRSCNNQKDYFRQTQGKKPIWGRPPKYITAEVRVCTLTTRRRNTQKKLNVFLLLYTLCSISRSKVKSIDRCFLLADGGA